MSRVATDWAWSIKVKSSTMKLLILSLADRADEYHCCYPSIKRLENDTGLNRKTIISNIKHLEKIGILVDTGERKGATQKVRVLRLSVGEQYQNRNCSEIGNSTENGTLNSTENGTQNQSLEPVNEPRGADAPAAIDRLPDAKAKTCPTQTIIDLYNEILTELPAVRIATKARRATIRARWNTSTNTQSLDWWRDYFLTCKDIPFLMGKNDRQWRADFDFLMTESKFAKIVEGGYHGGHQ